MRRLLLTSLLFVVLAAFALVAIAVRYGHFNQGPAFFVYVFVSIAALAAAMGVALPGQRLGQSAAQGVLLLGCVIFSLPFVWLVSTSFKYDEEIFVYPPRWMPMIPEAIEASPYVTKEEIPDLERPPGVEAERWQDVWPKLQERMWSRIAAQLPDSAAPGLSESELREAIVDAVWVRLINRIPDEVWSLDDASLAEAVVDRIHGEDVMVALDTSYRAVMLRELTVVDDQRVEQALPAEVDQLSRWRPVKGSVICLPTATDTTSPPLVLAYDFTDAGRFAVAADLPLPVAPEDLLSISLPMRQDRSWHRLGVTLEFSGQRYVLQDQMYLGQRRWQELVFKLAHKDDRDERDVGIWPLVLADDQANAFDAPGHFRLTLTVDRASRLVATWRKYTGNYRNAYFASGHRWHYLFNSAYLVILTVLGSLLSCSMVAYAFARLKWPGRDALFLVLLATMMLPGQVTMVPVFVIFKYLGWYNSLKALWVPSFLGTAFFIFMLRQFMKTIPTELEEAAKIDGCSVFGIYWRIILPLMRPALAAVAIFTFMNTWNDFMGPLIYINDQRLYPLSLGLFDFRTQYGAEYGMLMSASTLMTLPVVCIFFVAQRYFIEGITLTGLKA